MRVTLKEFTEKMEQFFSSPTEFRKVENDPEKFFRIFEEKKNRSFLMKKFALSILRQSALLL